MNILQELQQLDDKDIDIYIKEKIDYLTIRSAIRNPNIDVIGCNVDINPTLDLNSIDNDSIFVENHNFYVGYIPKNTKIVYGYGYNKLQVRNKGYYYYMDDDKYIYEFARYIKNKKIDNDTKFLFHVFTFINNYFFNDRFNKKDRLKMHKPIYKNNVAYYDVIREHSILDFKGNCSAKCTEIAALLSNIASVFGYDCVYMMGSLNGDDYNHAFNILGIDDISYLVDMSEAVLCYDINGNVVGKAPFMSDLEDFDNEELHDFILSLDSLVLNNYELLKINNKLFSIESDDLRVYKVEGNILEDEYIDSLKKKLVL